MDERMYQDQILKLRFNVIKAENERTSGKAKCISITEAREQLRQRVDQTDYKT